MWWKMADWVKQGGSIPDDQELIGELPGPTYKFDATGRVQLEAKEDMKKRGLPSPNKADGLALTFAAPVAHSDIRMELARLRRPGLAHEYDPLQQER